MKRSAHAVNKAKPGLCSTRPSPQAPQPRMRPNAASARATWQRQSALPATDGTSVRGHNAAALRARVACATAAESVLQLRQSAAPGL